MTNKILRVGSGFRSASKQLSSGEGIIPPYKRKRKPKRKGCRRRVTRDVESGGSTSDMKAAIKKAMKHGLTLVVNRIAGRGATDDSYHIEFRKNGFVVGDYWPQTGRLTIGGNQSFKKWNRRGPWSSPKDETWMDLDEAIDVVSLALKNSEAAVKSQRMFNARMQRAVTETFASTEP